MTMPPKQRQSRYHPDPAHNRSQRLQERDLTVIKQVLEDRFLSGQQIADLFYPSYDMAKKRLQKLWNAGFLKREFAPVSFGSSPAIYCLTAKGRDLLVSQGVVKPEEMRWHKDTNRGGFEFKRHELAINDIKVALIVATRESQTTQLYHFGKGIEYYDRVVNSDVAPHEKEYIPIRPDGFIVMQNQEGYHYFFLEVDRGTMPLKRIRTKIKGYRTYYYEGGFFEKYGQEGYRKEDYSFRVLMTCPSEETRNNRLEQACALGSNTMCWFAVQDEVVRDPFGKVWVRGKEFKEAIKSVSPDVEYNWMRSANKSERDQFIRNHVALQSIAD